MFWTGFMAGWLVGTYGAVLLARWHLHTICRDLARDQAQSPARRQWPSSKM